MLRKGHILAILVIIVSIFSSLSIANAEITVYEDHTFYLEYPEEWEVVDNWSPYPGEVLFNVDFRGITGISISVTKPDRNLLGYPEEDEILSANILAASEHGACTKNENGPCWNFKQLDKKVIAIGDKQAITVKYEAVLNDQDTIIRKVIFWQDDFQWNIVGKSVGDEIVWEKDIEKAIQSFKLLTSKKVEEPEPYQASLFVSPPDPDIILEKNLNINLILVGDEWSKAEKNTITDELPGYYDPIYVTNEEKVGIRYNYQYNFVSATEQDTRNLVRHMSANSFERPIWGSDLFDVPIWQAYWAALYHPDWNVEGNYRIIDALATEEYLYETIIGSNPSLTKPNSVNLIFLKTDLDDVVYLHNYFLTDVDKSTKVEHTYDGLMGYGGNYNMFYFDLYAVPWIDFDRQTFDYAEPPWISSLLDCSSEQCFRDLVIFHTKSSLNHIITPSFLYPIEYFEKYLLDIVVYDIPGGTSFTPYLLTKFVNEDLLIEEFENLFPFTEWEIQFSVENRETRGISLDFKDELKLKTPFVYSNDFGEDRRVSFIRSTNIQPHLLDWAASRAEEIKVNPQTTWHIPVLVVVDDVKTSDLYLDDFGVIGFAPGRNDDDTVPCCAFVVTNEKKIGENKVAMTDLVLHEVGHVLGLNHPFYSWDEFGDASQNNYFNWYASPMTYSFPPSACGNFFYFIYTDTCGNPNLSFTDFEKNRIADARMVSLLKKIDQSLESIPESEMAAIIQQKNSAKQKFNSGDIFSRTGALQLAIEAYESSEERFDIKPIIVSPSGIKDEISIPDWVRNNADWWSQGLISDKDFATGIEFMIKEGVIRVPVTSSGQVSEDAVIPDWVRNNAEWWSKGQISDKDFANGLQFLVEKGIIGI